MLTVSGTLSLPNHIESMVHGTQILSSSPLIIKIHFILQCYLFISCFHCCSLCKIIIKRLQQKNVKTHVTCYINNILLFLFMFYLHVFFMGWIYIKYIKIIKKDRRNENVYYSFSRVMIHHHHRHYHTIIIIMSSITGKTKYNVYIWYYLLIKNKVCKNYFFN